MRGNWWTPWITPAWWRPPVPSTLVADEALPDLDAVLGTFERVRVNLEKLERAWNEMASADHERHEELTRAFVDVAAALPAVDGFTVTAVPMNKSEVEIMRFEAGEVGEPEAYVSAEEQIDEPGFQLREYRFRYEKARRQVVRGHVERRMEEVERLIPEMVRESAQGDGPSWESWDRLSTVVAELDRLLGDAVPRRARWNDLARHLHFRADVDLHDIADMDWPSVRSEVEAFLFSGWEPVPVAVDDLQLLADSQPTGPVSTSLRWDTLDAEAFERVVFELVRSTDGYENANWLMNTHAPDRGRDIEVERVVADPLAGSLRSRVIIQCKHWQSRSVGLADIVACLESARLWEPPPIDTLVIASSGRFTQDAVQWVEKRRGERTVPRVDIWPESHLEMLLARRPQLVARFGLR